MNYVGLCRSYLVNRSAGKMCSVRTRYEDAVSKLNKLQSNKILLEQIKKDIKNGRRCTNLEEMENFLLRTGVTLKKLDELSVIHVAGTKGKGSTSAMCESILRAHGFRTGFYSSPHLVAVRERIRIDGQVISEEHFAKYFHQVYDLLDATKEYEGDMPKYFSFLTVMAFNLFLQEKVDVAVVEVGIGGIVDYTNVLRKVPVVGITALGLDHTSILGNSITQIAAAKAGIMKPGCVAYTVNQPAPAMDVLSDYAEAVQCPLQVVPEYNSYTFPESAKPNLPVDLPAYQTNASLAIQLAHAWMRIRKHGVYRTNGFKKEIINGCNGIKKPLNGSVLNGTTVTLPNETAKGLRECRWPGRYHIIQSDYAEFYLDGAHTKESMEICVQWFKDKNRCQDKILIFSATGDRNAEALLKPLLDINFKDVYFVIPTAHKKISQKDDNFSLVEQDELISRCKKHANIWEEKNNYSKLIVLECVADALKYVKKNCDINNKPSVLITGSLHLVGAALSIIDPNLST